MKSALAGHKFDVVYDLNGREAVETETLLAALPGGVEQYIYCECGSTQRHPPALTPHRMRRLFRGRLPEERRDAAH